MSNPAINLETEREMSRREQLHDESKHGSIANNPIEKWFVTWISAKTGRPASSRLTTKSEANKIYDSKEAAGLSPTLVQRYIGGWA